MYDTRDDEYNTHQGLLLEAGAQVGSGDDGYTRLYSVLPGLSPGARGDRDRRADRRIRDGRHATLNSRYTLPGWEKEVPVLGGQQSHRRFDTGRFAGKGVLFGNFEVRHDVLPFGDLGAITLLGVPGRGAGVRGGDRSG